MDAEGTDEAEDRGEALRRVGAGLRLVLLGLAAMVAARVAFAVAAALFVRLQGKDAAAMIQALRESNLLRSLGADRPDAAMVLNGLVVLSCVLGAAGKVFFARGPAAAGASGFAILSAFCDGLGLGLYAAGQTGPAGAASAELGDLSGLVWLLAYFLFLRGLARLSAYLKSPGLMIRTRRQQLGSMALLFGSFLAAIVASGGGGAGLGMLGFVVGLGALVLFVLYARLLFDLRRAAESEAAAEAQRA